LEHEELEKHTTEVEVMYSWGDDTKNWNKPGAYKFDEAKAPYLKKLASEAAAKGSRAYSVPKTPNFALTDPKKIITSESENPVLITVDGTGSMKTWPAEIFDRLPLFYQTLSQYRSDLEVSHGVLGDAKADQWPIQVCAFGRGTTLDDHLKALRPEGGGGPGIRESYELMAYFADNHVRTPRAQLPFWFLMGDEGFYQSISRKEVQHFLGDNMLSDMNATEVWWELSQRFDIYLLRKPYPGKDETIEQQWAEAIGEQKIIPVYDKTRVVDVAMGLVARRWGYFSNFEQNLAARQDEPAIASVMESLRAAPDLGVAAPSAPKLAAGKSIKLLGGGA
jgi:hypothetical protein